jgi:hypothetical protein
VVRVLVNGVAEIKCDVSSNIDNDQVLLVVWYKNNLPIYRWVHFNFVKCILFKFSCAWVYFQKEEEKKSLKNSWNILMENSCDIINAWNDVYCKSMFFYVWLLWSHTFITWLLAIHALGFITLFIVLCDNTWIVYLLSI